VRDAVRCLDVMRARPDLDQWVRVAQQRAGAAAQPAEVAALLRADRVLAGAGA
jgi:hypothetical protein